METTEIPYRIVVKYAGEEARAAAVDCKLLGDHAASAAESVNNLTSALAAATTAKSGEGPTQLAIRIPQETEYLQRAKAIGEEVAATKRLAEAQAQLVQALRELIAVRVSSNQLSQSEADSMVTKLKSDPKLEEIFQLLKNPAQAKKPDSDQNLTNWFVSAVEGKRANLEDKERKEQKRIMESPQPSKQFAESEVDTSSATAAQQAALDRLTASFAAQKFAVTELGQELQKVGQQGVTLLGSGLSKAFGQVIQGTKDAKTAFAEFGASFLQQIAQMIMQALILAAIKSVLAGTKFGEFLFPLATPPKPSAEGSLTPRLAAAGALNGVQTVSTATYFPAFNTIAGEAGTEVLAVLSRPRLMDMGGLATYVGQVQGHDLAMTDARELQSAIGNRQSAIAGGRLEIAITMSPEVEARVLRNSVEQAVVEINTALSTDSPTSAAVKSLTA